jgi:ubiquinone/menaquinone biosynthesis C-methylase UbiE
MTRNVWDQRADAYRLSADHAGGEDLDLLVEWCEPGEGVKVIDVATGGGHVARRLREAGCDVVTTDLSPGMRPDVLCPAEDLPFADGSFDVAVTRIAAHHFADVRRAVGELARVSNRLVVVEDNMYFSDAVEEAERLRDPSHVRNYSEAEWRELFTEAGLEPELLELIDKQHALAEWLARTACFGADAQRVRELLAHEGRLTADGSAWINTKILVRARKSQT